MDIENTNLFNFTLLYKFESSITHLITQLRKKVDYVFRVYMYIFLWHALEPKQFVVFLHEWCQKKKHNLEKHSLPS